MTDPDMLHTDALVPAAAARYMQNQPHAKRGFLKSRGSVCVNIMFGFHAIEIVV